MTFEECIAQGLLRKSGLAGERVSQSIELGDKFLKSAERNLEMGELEVCEIISYNALFHFARALLFHKGLVERSHACLFIALKKLYQGNAGLFDEADRMRRERHNLQYGGFAASRESSLYSLKFAKSFGEAAKKLLKTKAQ